MSKDLFGVEAAEPSPRKPGQANGYAARPGTGPAGETCGTCKNACYTQPSKKRFYKCKVIKHRWTSGPGTDIKLKSPACSFFIPE